MNWYFASEIAWLIPAVYEAFRIISLVAGNDDELAHGKVNFKRVVLRALDQSDARQTLLPIRFMSLLRPVSVAAGNYNGLVNMKRVHLKALNDSDCMDDVQASSDSGSEMSVKRLSPDRLTGFLVLP